MSGGKPDVAAIKAKFAKSDNRKIRPLDSHSTRPD
jgi:hypothetical protein